ncbi:MAG: flagellar M-ring protein FliF [Hyphomicrobiaceae bacterium]
MISSDQIKSIARNFSALGAQRQLALALVFVVIVGSITTMSYLLSKPALQTLYTGLIKTDVTGIGTVLSQNGVPYEVGTKGDSISVPYGRVDEVRMLLAERGLPHGPSAGYELFDNMGSIGLTSFMQEVTRKRALEGELARTIQSMKGVLAARVHIVMAEAGSFRRVGRKPSASVVIRVSADAGQTLASAVRHLVAASVPGLAMSQVAVLNTDGTLLASGGDPAARAPNRNAGLEKELEGSLKQNISQTLSPFLGLENFRISVAARLNTDKREIRETAYDPETKVERSVRVVKETKNSQNSKSSKAVGVEQNVPNEEGAAGSPDQSKRNDERREELTNFEVGSKTIATVSNGYRIERLTVAVVLNSKRMKEILGTNSGAGQMEGLVKQVESLVSAAGGLVVKRGDEVKVSAVEFMPASKTLQPVEGPGIMYQLLAHTGALINGLVLMGVAALLVFFGIRPVTRVLLKDSGAIALESEPSPLAVSGEPNSEAGIPFDPGAGDNLAMGFPQNPAPFSLEEFDAANNDDSPKAKLEKLIEDEDAAVEVMRQWMKEEARA